MFKSVRPHGQQPTRLLCPWDYLGKNARVGCHFLLPKKEGYGLKRISGDIYICVCVCVCVCVCECVCVSLTDIY